MTDEEHAAKIRDLCDRYAQLLQAAHIEFDAIVVRLDEAINAGRKDGLSIKMNQITSDDGVTIPYNGDKHTYTRLTGLTPEISRTTKI